MANYSFSISGDAAVVMTARLERIGKHVVPTAAKKALNMAAMDVKKNTMPKEARHNFVHRSPSFWKAASKVEFARGGNLSEMKSMVGFYPPAHDTGRAVEDLEEQEYGGNIGGRSFIALKGARTRQSWHKNVKANLRLANVMENMINAQNVKFKGADRNKKQKWVRAAIQAKKVFGDDAFVLGQKRADGGRTISRIDRVAINRKKKTIKFKRTPVYTYKPGGKVHVARTNFMQRASYESGLSLEKNYQDEAIRQLKNHMRR